MIPEERRRRLLDIVSRSGTASITDLTQQLDVSHMTIRRDVHLLEEDGRLISVAGGVAVPARIAVDASHEAKLRIRQDEKRAIAAVAVSRIAPSDVVYLDAGTTTLLIAELIARDLVDHDLTIVTPDFAVASAFRATRRVSVHALGGHVDLANMATDGPFAAASLGDYNIDVAFMSTSSFDLRGLSVPAESKVVVKRAVVENSRRCVLVADSSKYGRVASHRAVKLSAFSAIITDAGLPDSAAEFAAQQGIELVLT